jgi:hypothetical protein
MKTSVCVVTHHKPYFIMASLISLALQKFNDYDLHIIFIKGDGSEKKYPKYDRLSKKFKKNSKLSNSSKEIITIINNFKKIKKIHIFKNDHALDSGAWYKFINKKIWKEYDYNFFLMEGFLFKSNDTFKNILKFIDEKKPDVVMLGSEKVFTTKKRLLNYAVVDVSNEFNTYHQEIIRKTFQNFCKFKNFNKIYSNWKNIKIFSKNSEENLDLIFNFPKKKYFSFYIRIKLFIKYILLERKLYNPFSDLIFYNEGTFRYLLPRKLFFKEEYKFGNVMAHIEPSPFFYVNGCQHIFSNKYLTKLNHKLKYIKINKVLNYPFVGTPLEFIWGILPKSLGFKKWFSDCIHRPRKNFLTYKKEDTAFFLKKYLELYSDNKIKIKIQNNKIKIYKLSNEVSYIKPLLGKAFFTE